MVNDAQVRVRIVFVWLHDLSTSVSHSRWLARIASTSEAGANDARAHATALLFLGTLFEEDLAKDVLFLAEGVVVLDVIVVRLVKHAV